MADEMMFTTLQHYMDNNDQNGAKAYLHGLLNDKNLSKQQQVKIYSSLGRTAYYEKDVEEAKTHFLRALEVDPDDFYAAFYLGLIAQQVHKPVTALGLYLSCLRNTNGGNDPGFLAENIVSRLESFAFEDEQIGQFLAEQRHKNSRYRFGTALPKISILMLCYNKLEYSEQCMKALFKNTDYPNFELIVVDNASTDDTPAFLETLGSRITFIRSATNLGFVKGNNLAARRASGEFLVFLNNDTEVQKGWLSALLKTFILYPDAGAVGSKLIYPDGRLQEAGGAVFQDASGWNYGRGGNSEEDRYQFVREVDYCSGASLMVRKELFTKLGGFDERFAPAYYEDTDICFAVRKLGFKVYYSPESHVVHHEGATAGTDLGSGFKKYQRINKDKFFDKWKDELSLQYPNDPELIYQFSNRKKGKRILILDDCPPLPDKASGSLKIYRTVRQMISLGYQVTFIHLMGKGVESNNYLAELKCLGVELIWFHYEDWWNIRDTPEAVKIRRNLIAGLELKKRNYDLIYIAFWWVAAFFIDHIRKEAPECPLLVDSVDLHYLREQRQAELANDKKAMRKALETEKAELETYSKADGVSVVSEIEVGELRKKLPNKPVFIISNTHDSEETRVGFEERKDFLFVGSFNHPPNQDAVLFFAQDIFPLIKKDIPDAKLYIVGNNPTETIKQLSGNDIIVTGWVPFTQPYLEKCRVSVIPLRYGAGVKGKVGETLSYGLPMVSTTVGVEAMHIENEEHAFVADDPLKFAEYCVRLHQEKETWEQFSSKGKEVIEKHFSTRTALRRIQYITSFETREAFKSHRGRTHEEPPEDMAVEIKSNLLNPLFLANKDGILFAGDFSVPHYSQALDFLLNDIVPFIRKELADVKLYIAGKEAALKAKDFLCDNIIAVESDEDIATCIANAKMLLLPIMNLDGIEERVGDSLSWNIPAITTSCIANHFRLSEGKEIITGDTKESLATNVVKLQNDISLWGTLFANSLAPDFRKKTARIEQAVKTDKKTRIRAKNMVSIILLTLNQLHYTKECIASIRQYTPQLHEIILVDNGSTDGTVAWLRRMVTENPHYKLIENNQNLGFSKGCNQGISVASGEYILLLNNDVVVTENWLSGMLECLNSAQDIGIVGPMTNNISGPQKVPAVGYTAISGLDEYARAFQERNRNRKIPHRRVVGFCMLFRSGLVDDVGLLDECFGSGNFEDDDYCLRAELLGYRNVIVGDVFIHHYGSRSFVGNNIDYRSALFGNKSIFSNKWSGIDTESPLGNKMQAVNALDKALELNHRGQLEKAAEAILEGIRHAPETRNLYYALAAILIDAKQFKEALNVLTELLPDDNDAQRLSLAAYCEEGLGRDEQAEQYARRVLALNPSSAQAMNLLGVLAYKKEDLCAARDLFEKAAAADPGYGDPCTNLGIISWSEDRSHEALALLERGFILSPTMGDNLAAYHVAVTDGGDLARLEQVLSEARALYPLNRRLVFLFIDTLIKENKYDAAMQEIELAMMLFGIDDGILAAAIDIRNKTVPQVINAKSKHKRSLSLCMIVKNEELHLPKCLMSIKSVVDEIIVLDTGSSDRTKEIARAFGATVYDISWTGDFAEARNSSLAKATGEWILVLDADEVISSLDHAELSRLINKKNSRKVAYSLLTRNYVVESDVTGWNANNGSYPAEEAGTGWAGSIKVRLFPRDSRIKFVNPVHELVEPSLQEIGMPVKESGISIHHYGKLDRKKGRSKGEAYYQLGRKKLEETGVSVDALQELAVQAGELNKFDEALELWDRVLKIKPDMALAYVNRGSIYLKLDRYSEAQQALRKAVELAPRMREAVCSHALCELYAGNASGAVSTLQDLVRREPDYPSATILLSMAYCCHRKKDLGLDLFKKLPNNRSSLIESIQRVAGKLLSAGRVEYAASLVDAVSESGYVDEGLLRLREECREQVVRQ